ncbi:MAG: hypothetical protein ABI778_12230 [Ignavibacteriota bacterium]
MKLLSFLLLLLLAAQPCLASRPDIDTVTIIRLSPGLDGDSLGARVVAKFDTLLWSDVAGVGIIKFAGTYYGNKGEFRIAYDKGFISQVSFVAPTHNAEETKKMYGLIAGELSGIYGPPDMSSKSPANEMRWEGLKQSIAVKAVDGTQYVTIALSKFGL